MRRRDFLRAAGAWLGAAVAAPLACLPQPPRFSTGGLVTPSDERIVVGVDHGLPGGSEPEVYFVEPNGAARTLTLSDSGDETVTLTIDPSDFSWSLVFDD